MKFRNDISGLRAFAVVPVLLFHSGVPWFTGGFLGVDVFFVISGFLITGIIIDGVKDGSFTYTDFYDKRIRRIFPALIFVVFICCAMSPFFMVPYDLKNFGQSIFATMMSVNNILLYMTSGYWSLASEFKPLYHTWSLSVEEQFYILMPLLVIIFIRILKLSSHFLVFIFLCIISISFFYSFYLDDREFNFLILFSRAWELLFGSIGAVLVRQFKFNRRTHIIKAIAIIGFGMIVLSYINPYLISSNQAIVNIIPVFGTFLILVFSTPEYGIGRLLAFRPFVFIGLISYSTYLWHQPLLSYLRLASDTPPSVYVQVLFSILSIPFAYMSWKFIENPCRDSKIISNYKFYSLFSVLFVAIVSFGLSLHMTYGFQSRSLDFTYDGNPQSFVDRAYQYSGHDFTEHGKINTLVIGNSFARDFINVVESLDKAKRINIVYSEWNGESIDPKIVELISQADYIFVALNWGHPGRTESVRSTSDLAGLLSEMTTANIYFVGTKNFGWNNNFVKIMKRDEAILAKVWPLKEVSTFNRNLKAELNDKYIDLMGYYIDSDGKVPLFYQGKFITYDGNHLTKMGVDFLGGYLLNDPRLYDLFNGSSNQESLK